MMTNLASEFALVIGSSVALSVVAKATLACLAAFIVAWICRRNRASVRHLIFAATFGVLLLLPMAAVVMPPIALRLLVDTADDLRPVTTHTASESPSVSAAEFRSLAAGSERTIPLSIRDVLGTAWLVGVVTFLAPMAAGVWQLRRIRRRGLPWREGQALVEHLAADAGVHRRVEVLRHEYISGPLTCGLLRPAILLPCEAQSWNTEMLTRALVHELEHIRRADWLTQCLSRTVCALYWFHPFVWTAWRRLGLEAERACDDAVLRRYDATEYASLLVTVAQRDVHQRHQPVLAMASRGDLSTRVAAVLDTHQARGSVGMFGVAFTITMTLLSVGAVSPLILVAEPSPAPGTASTAQSPAAPNAQFEVTSIKRNNSGAMVGSGARSVGSQPGGRFVMIDGPAIVLIRSAYPDAVEILGLPEWASSSERYDVEARGNLEATGEQLQGMLRTMLAERFELAAHYEMREQQTYALMLARSDGRLGPQLRRYDGDCTTYLDPVRAGREKPEVPLPSNGAPACGYRFNGRRIIAGGVSMNALTGPLRGLAGRIVVDKTGLVGHYEFTLEMGADVTVFTALREQLDLKLESEVNQLPVLVIDRIERPTEN